MLLAILTLAVLLGIPSMAAAGAGGILSGFSRAERFGLAGLLLLGTIGTATFLVQWGAGLSVGMGCALVISVGIASWFAFRGHSPCRLNIRALLVPCLALLPALFFAVLTALTPPDTLEWDTMAYHLAVPKIWLAEGGTPYLPYIHHSNFPFAIDSLFMLGLLAGQTLARVFTAFFLLFGAAAIFGFCRRRLGDGAALLALIGFTYVPLILWQSGTNYLDVAHGLYAGLGLLYTVEILVGQKGPWWLPASLLGFACASKYTGLQTVMVAGVLCVMATRWNGGRSAWLGAKIALVAVLIASPWFVRNVVNTGNPVYPFFYSVLGGKHWDAFRAEIYTEEQKSFGVHGAANLGHAVLGLAYQPGRYNNPAPQVGLGSPNASIGFALLFGALVLSISGKGSRFDRMAMLGCGLSLVLWFFLSQQSRYIASLAPVLAYLSAVAWSATRWRTLVLAGVGVQTATTLGWWAKEYLATRWEVATGAVSVEDYLSRRVAFYDPAKVINDRVQGGKVGLYDEVFGYWLDVPYFWANPGHCTLIPYETMQNAGDLMKGLESVGISHVYVNLLGTPGALRDHWRSAMNGAPWPEGEREKLMSDLRTKWKPLLSDAVASRRLALVEDFGRGLLFKIERDERPGETD